MIRQGTLAVVLDVLAQVLLVGVILLFLDRLGAGARNGPGALARARGAHAGRQGKGPFRVAGSAGRTGRRFIALHDLLELIAALAALEVVDRHARTIPEQRAGAPRQGPR